MNAVFASVVAAYLYALPALLIVLGLTAGASAPEDLVQGVIDACRERFDVTVDEVETAKETVTFKLPRVLSA